MRLVLRERAVTDLEGISDWISRDDPEAARGIVARLFARMEQLLTPGLARMGRRGHRAGVRELIDYPYIVAYRIDDVREEIIILSVMHGARNR